MSENLKTIKELADELGTSKQNLQYHLNFLPSKNRQKNSKGITVLTVEEQGIIKDRVKKSSKKNRQKSGKKNSTKINLHEQKSDFDINKYLLNEIDELKKNRDKQLAVKDEQIKNLVDTQKQTQNLLDQQQRLALQDKQLLNEYKFENDKLKTLKAPNHNIEQEREFAETMRATYEEELVKLNQELSEQQKLREQAEEERNELMEKQRKLLAREQPKRWWKFWMK